jgi:hypothetical protein
VAGIQTYRWALLGNAVSVEVAEWIGERLSQPHAHKYINGAKDRGFTVPAAYVHDTAGDGRPSS